MAIAASSRTDAVTRTRSATPHRTSGLWLALLAAFIGLTAVLALLPDGTAEPVQAAIGWLVVAVVAVMAVMAVAKGLERLLDCDAN